MRPVLIVYCKNTETKYEPLWVIPKRKAVLLMICTMGTKSSNKNRECTCTVHKCPRKMEFSVDSWPFGWYSRTIKYLIEIYEERVL